MNRWKIQSGILVVRMCKGKFDSAAIFECSGRTMSDSETSNARTLRRYPARIQYAERWNPLVVDTRWQIIVCSVRLPLRLPLRLKSELRVGCCIEMVTNKVRYTAMAGNTRNFTYIAIIRYLVSLFCKLRWVFIAMDHLWSELSD